MGSQISTVSGKIQTNISGLLNMFGQAVYIEHMYSSYKNILLINKNKCGSNQPVLTYEIFLIICKHFLILFRHLFYTLLTISSLTNSAKCFRFFNLKKIYFIINKHITHITNVVYHTQVLQQLFLTCLLCQ